MAVTFTGPLTSGQIRCLLLTKIPLQRLVFSPDDAATCIVLQYQVRIPVLMDTFSVC